MHKHSDGANKPLFIYSLAVLVSASAGIALRTAEIGAALEPETGLAVFTPLTVATAVFSCLAAAFFIAFSRLTDLSALKVEYKEAFRPATVLPLAASVIAFIIMLIGAYGCFLHGLDNIHPAASGLLALLAFLSGAAGFALSYHALTGKNTGDSMLSAVADVVFLCFWTVLYYRQQAANPVLIDCMYAFLGLCSSALAFFHIAGFTAGRPSPRSVLLFSGMGIYFCAVALVNSPNVFYSLFFAAVIIRLFAASVLLLRNAAGSGSKTQV